MNHSQVQSHYHVRKYAAMMVTVKGDSTSLNGMPIILYLEREREGRVREHSELWEGTHVNMFLLPAPYSQIYSCHEPTPGRALT